MASNRKLTDKFVLSVPNKAISETISEIGSTETTFLVNQQSQQHV